MEEVEGGNRGRNSEVTIRAVVVGEYVWRVEGVRRVEGVGTCGVVGATKRILLLPFLFSSGLVSPVAVSIVPASCYAIAPFETCLLELDDEYHRLEKNNLSWWEGPTWHSYLAIAGAHQMLIVS